VVETDDVMDDEEEIVLCRGSDQGAGDADEGGQGCRQGSPWLGSVTCHCCGAFRIQPILFVVRRYGNVVVRQYKIHVRSSTREIKSRQEKELDHTSVPPAVGVGTQRGYM